MTGDAGAGDGAPPDRLLDLRGLNCPLPVLMARRALAAMAPGARLVVLATDPMSAIDIPHACRSDGHAVSRAEREGGVLEFSIRRGDRA